MFKRKLRVLGYPTAETFNVHDDKEFRNLVVWLEDQKIRNCSVQYRNKLRDVHASNWMKLYKIYLREVTGLYYDTKREEEIEWLLASAVKMEYNEKAKDSKTAATENVKDFNNTPKVISASSLDKLDFQSPDFIKGVKSLANILKINEHPDHLKTLRAITKLVSSRLHSEALANPKSFIVKGTPFPFQDADSGFNLDDNVLNQAAKILRLLYIHNLRSLQTEINECIAAVQTFTANPKTDTKLGQVGR